MIKYLLQRLQSVLYMKYIVIAVCITLCFIFIEGCKSGGSVSKSSDIPPTADSPPNRESRSDKQVQQDEKKQSSSTVNKTRNRGGSGTGSSSTKTASLEKTTVPNTTSAQSISKSKGTLPSDPKATAGTKIGNAIVEQARAESGSVDPNSPSSRAADQVSAMVVSPQENSTASPKRTSGKEFEDIGAKCFEEALRKSFNNL